MLSAPLYIKKNYNVTGIEVFWTYFVQEKSALSWDCCHFLQLLFVFLEYRRFHHVHSVPSEGFYNNISNNIYITLAVDHPEEVIGRFISAQAKMCLISLV